MTFAQDCLLHYYNNEPTGPLNREYTATHGEKKYYYIAAEAEKREKMEFFSFNRYTEKVFKHNRAGIEQNVRISFTAVAGDLEYMHKCMNTPR